MKLLKRPPDFVIGPVDAPYLKRWWLIPRNHWFNIYLHQILTDDDDRALHDHPWWNLSIILKGCYREIRKDGVYLRKRFSFTFRRAETAHRLVLPVVNGGVSYCWSLFITGPVIREWGFYCPKGWRHWRDFVAPNDKGQVGRGCGEMQ